MNLFSLVCHAGYNTPPILQEHFVLKLEGGVGLADFSDWFPYHLVSSQVLSMDEDMPQAMVKASLKDTVQF
jgi:hypothetical protein